jgi:hypothetical protein
VLAAMLALAAAPAAPARAGQDPGLRLGYYAGADADEAVPTIGVFGRVDLPGPLNLEVSADYRRESLLGGELEATVIPVRVTAVFSFSPVVSPYLAAGAGLDYVGLDFGAAGSGAADDSNLVYEVHAGGGVEVSLGPLSLIADLRYCRAGAVSTDAVRAALGHAYDPSGWQASVSAGISF